ncbi:MAG: hypothetical protein ABH807_01100 [Candidatus Shapirobacteria bacterium]
MRDYLILIPIFFLALLRAVFLPVNLVILPVLGWASFASPRSVFIIAFGAGLFLDAALLGRLGGASLLFLLFSLLVVLYRRRFDPAHPLFLPVFTVFCSLAFRRGFFWPELALLVLGSFLWRRVFRFFEV